MSIHTSLLSLNTNNKSDNAYFTLIQNHIFNDLYLEKEKILHQSELLFLNSLKFEKRKKTFLLGRFAAKLSLSNLFQSNELKSINIISGIFGNPVAQTNISNSADISISHCKNFTVAVAFPSFYILGIDIEAIKKNNVIKKYITNLEWKSLTSFFHSLEEKTLLTIIWTAKESLSKALKCGLNISFKLLEIKNITLISENHFSCDYVNFPQYKCEFFVASNHIVSIVLPNITSLQFDNTTFTEKL